MARFLKVCGVILSSGLLAACSPAMYSSAQAPHTAAPAPMMMSPQPGTMPMGVGQPMAGGGQMVAGPMAGPNDPFGMTQSVQMMHSQTMSSVSNLKERVRRVERAMIRLDRRMQLIERNELGRMSGGMGESGQGQGEELYQPMSFVPDVGLTFGAAPQAQGLNPAQVAGMGSGFQPVAHRQAPTMGSVISSSLQPAPSAPSAAPAFANKLPSLADSGNRKTVGDSSVAIWTVNYQENKIWPEREQLPASRDVVEMLRQDEPVTLFARGMRPTSKEFRERVRAISRYLSRVSSREQVAISAMPADHLKDDTIEIVATN